MLPIELTNEDIRNSEAYKEYYAVATVPTPPKTKASVMKTKSSSDTTVTPPTAVAGTRLSASTKGKQPAKASKAKSLTVLSEVAMTEAEQLKLAMKRSLQQTYISQASGSGADEGTGEEFIHPKLSIRDKEETKDEESFDPIAKMPKNSDDEDVHTTQEFKDTHVTLTLVNPDGQQQNSSMSFQFVTSMLNPTPDSDRLGDEAQAENEEFLKNLDENIQKIIKEQVKKKAEVLTRSSNSSKTTYAIAADLSKMELKKILIEIMEGKKSIHRSDEQRNFNKALVEAYEFNKIILDTYGDTITLERCRDDDADKDEEPSLGSDRRGANADYSRLEKPSHQEFETGAADDQPIAEASQHPKWFQQQKKPPTLDHDWNKTFPATHESIQPCISELAKQADSHSSFNELMDTHVDFSAFLTNRLKVDTLILELLARPTYELMKGSCKSLVELEFFLEEVYKITVCRDDDKLYKFKECDFKRLRIRDNEDMLMLLVQGKLTNLTVEECFSFNVSLRMFTRSIVIQRRMEDLQLGVESYQKKLNLTRSDTYRSDLKRKEAYTAYSNPRGFIYHNKDKQNRLMQIDELHKFSDGTINDVRTALDDCLKGIRMKYLPQTIWRKSDKERAAVMIQAIDKQLKTRRIMRSLERFVGGRLYERDFRMLQRTISFMKQCFCSILNIISNNTS
nr:hypothetical protein [Tanacetum cinerariifolium]